MRLSFAILLAAAVLLASTHCSFGQAGLSKENWDKNSPGVKLEARELGRTQISGHTVVMYNLYASGMSAGQQYTLWQWNIGGDPQPAASAVLNTDGKVVSSLADPAHHVQEDPVNIRAFGGRGQPLRFGLVSDDGQLQAFARVIPFPIQTSNGACHLSAEMEAPNYAAVAFVGSGFLPGEQLTVKTHSENEGGENKAVAAPDGTSRNLVLPFVKGKASGEIKFEIRASGCTIALEIPWGQGSYQLQ
ncbi:MAG TPA: hypothetical protein VMT28_15885 [Terriglobales bacterium]|jgi:hypothetical protein|nr:hypothetical protein [Terriglobales bacterium]